MPLFGNASWHMWGSTRVITVEHAPPADIDDENQPVQLARIDYKRPETWTFFLYAKILQGVVRPGDVQELTVDFDILAGIGRSLVNTVGGPIQDAFARFSWTIAAGVDPSSRPPKWTTVSRTPPTQDGDATSAFAFHHFPAQSITSFARLRGDDNVAGTYKVEVGAFFAPYTHVRPDWFKAIDKNLNQSRFRSDETGGV